MVRLEVRDGAACGHFTWSVEFMKLRTQRGPTIVHDDYVPPGSLKDAETTTTPLTEAEFVTGQFTALPFALGLRVPYCRQAVADRREGARPVWFYSLSDLSWACVMFREGEREASVWQSGPRRLWDEVSDAYQWWRDQGAPDVTRFGLTVTTHSQHAWLDDPGQSWPV
jgi:hypothetical protein